MKLVDRGKRALQAYLARSGRTIAPAGAVASPTNLLRVLQHHGFVPQTVFDIGVAYGTPWLYAAFPKAKFHLIDPTRESLPHMQQWAKQLDAEIHNVALGETESEINIRNRSTIEHSTILEDVTKPKLEGSYAIQMLRFDQIFRTFDEPTFCKIDVEGFEKAVIAGMAESINKIDVIVVEISLITLYKNGSDFYDIVDIMKQSGFSVYDICGATRRPFDQALHQIDAAFVKTNSYLRTKTWS